MLPHRHIGNQNILFSKHSLRIKIINMTVIAGCKEEFAAKYSILMQGWDGILLLERGKYGDFFVFEQLGITKDNTGK